MTKVTLSEGDEDFLAVFKKMVRYREERDKIEAETRKAAIEECAKFIENNVVPLHDPYIVIPSKMGTSLTMKSMADAIRMLGENNE